MQFTCNKVGHNNTIHTFTIFSCSFNVRFKIHIQYSCTHCSIYLYLYLLLWQPHKRQAKGGYITTSICVMGNCPAKLRNCHASLENRQIYHNSRYYVYIYIYLCVCVCVCVCVFSTNAGWLRRTLMLVVDEIFQMTNIRSRVLLNISFGSWPHDKFFVR
jgi:hypothetical protein